METKISKDIKLDKVIERVREATSENDHNGARQILARTLNNKYLQQCYRHVEILHHLFGCMPESLMELRRTELDPKLIAQLEKRFPEYIDRIKAAL